MKILNWPLHAAICVVLSLFALSAASADYPAPKEADWIAQDFRFHTGEVMPELRLHYTTVGEPSGEPVLMLHGTAGSGAGMLTPAFASELFGPGQPLDAAKYFIILPDAIGAGKSSKPSDGFRTKFPKYNYDDMVTAQYSGDRRLGYSSPPFGHWGLDGRYADLDLGGDVSRYDGCPSAYGATCLQQENRARR
jgi:homoserine O-acetyltransferase